MKKITLLHNFRFSFLFILTISIYSCSKDDSISHETEASGSVGFSIQKDKLHFSSKEELKDFIDNSSEKEFTEQIRTLQEKGFRPLTPIFLENETEAYNEFLIRKRDRLASKSKNILSSRGDSNILLEELDEDDEIIADPSFAAVLNEDRAIYVGDSLHVFTSRGHIAVQLKMSNICLIILMGWKMGIQIPSKVIHHQKYHLSLRI
ncbi:hypothetical protein [Sinomicrobium sp. M5D2P17]